MAMQVKVVVSSAESLVLEDKAEVVVCPAEMGEIGVMPRHAPLLSRLKPGLVRVIREGKTQEALFVNGGILEVQPHLVTVLSDTVERASDLDEASAKAAQKAAEERLAGQLSDFDLAKAQAELIEQAERLRAIQRLREQGYLK